MKQRETDIGNLRERRRLGQSCPACGPKACGPGSSEAQQEGMQLPIGRPCRVKEIFKLADDGAGDEVLSGESEVLRLCTNFIVYRPEALTALGLSFHI